jgi:transcriptional regulator with XRE-family HTH domain
LAARVRQLRTVEHLSLDALAERSGLSKGTVVAIEQGKANPSIGVLCRLALAFSRSVTELLVEPSAHVPAAAIERTAQVTLWSTTRGSEAVLQSAIAGRTMFELWSWCIAEGDVHHADAHSVGTRELLSVIEGTLVVTVGEEVIVLRAGEAARLVADQAHSYACGDGGAVRFTMAVLESGGIDRA